MLLLLVSMILARKLVGFLPFRKMYNVFENSMMLYYTSLELKNALNFTFYYLFLDSQRAFQLALQISLLLT